MTNAWGDISNTKLIMVLGSNFVENHPGVVQQVNAAFENNAAKFVAVDPRRTRTVVWGEQHASGSAFGRIRPGTNGALICGLMNYAIANTAMTGVPAGNTSTAGTTTTLIASDVTFNVNELVGRYIRLTGAGFEPSWRKITANTTTTVTFTPAANKNTQGKYEICKRPLVDSVYVYNNTDGALLLNNDHDTSGNVDYSRTISAGTGAPDYATTRLTDYADKYSPNETWDALNASGSVFRALKARMAHYDPATVEQICGITHAEFTALAEMVTEPLNRPGTIMYAMGGTQHTHAAQDLHAYCLLQLLLGNMSKNGGGVNALRGIHNVQGSTDQGVLYSSMPGYSDVPDTNAGNTTYYNYMNTLFGNDGGTGLQQVGFRNMMHSYFRQGTGAPSTHETTPYASATNYNFDLLPQGNGYNHVKMFQNMKESVAVGDRVEFLMCLGQNPAVTEPNLGEIRTGLREVDTLVCVDMYMSETATCDRKDSTKRTILLPSCAHVEEAGSVTNSARLIYWRYMATRPKDGSKSDLQILLMLAKKLSDKSAFAHITGKTRWDQHGSPDADAYEVLYGRQYHGWAASGDPKDLDWGAQYGSETHYNGLERTVGEAVAEEVYKQMGASSNDTGVTNRCAISGYGTSYGSLWIYAMSVASPTTYPCGSRLAADAPAGSVQVTLERTLQGTTSGMNGSAASGTVIIGNIGAPGASGVATADGGNEEERTVSAGITGLTLTVPALSNDHYAGELVTQKGAWSNDARDGLLIKSRATYDPGDNKLYGRFGWAWLYNRHVFYNNNPCGAASGNQYWFSDQTQPGSVAASRKSASGDRLGPDYLVYCELYCPNGPAGNTTCKAPGDTFDYWVAPDARARLFVHHKSVLASNPNEPADHNDSPPVRSGTALDGVAYDKLYRKYSALADWDHHDTTSTTYPQRPSRFPKHWEPHETPEAAHTATYGRTGDNPTGSLGTTTSYPLALTTFRICWHFQGGPMTRNVPWLAELDPDPYIEINSADAFTAGVETGDNVYVRTARIPAGSGPYKARVGTGSQANQNIKRGVVGIPWHWGKALGVTSSAPLVDGASANECTIDAMDTNIKMPESKACLCRITTT